MFLAIALPVLASLLASLSSIDLAYHLRAGDEILASGSIPRVDAWTFTAEGLPWLDQQWGSQVILADRLSTRRLDRLAFLRAALVGVIFGCLVLIARRRLVVAQRRPADARCVRRGGDGARPSPAAAGHGALRPGPPHRFGSRSSSSTAVGDPDPRGPVGQRARQLLPGAPRPRSCLARGRRRRGRPRRGLTSSSPCQRGRGLCDTVRPAVWAYAFGLSTNAEVTRRVTEWQPTTIRDGVGILFFASVAAVVVLIARAGGRSRGRPWPGWASSSLSGSTPSVVSPGGRSAPWYPSPDCWRPRPGPRSRRQLPTPPMMRAQRRCRRRARARRAWRCCPSGDRSNPRRDPAGVLTDAPPGVTAALRELTEPGEQVFNPQAWGSWFEFAVPEVKVALDSRIEFFPVESGTPTKRYRAGAKAGSRDWRHGVSRRGRRGPVTSPFATRFEAAGWVPSVCRRGWVDLHERSLRHRPHGGSQRGQDHGEPIDVHDRRSQQHRHDGHAIGDARALTEEPDGDEPRAQGTGRQQAGHAGSTPTDLAIRRGSSRSCPSRTSSG